MSNRFPNEEHYYLFIEIFPEWIEGSYQRNIPGAGRLIRKSRIKQIYKSNTTHEIHAQAIKAKSQLLLNNKKIRRPPIIPRKQADGQKEKDCYCINIVMTDDITYVEAFDAKEMNVPVGTARAKRDERYDQLKKQLTKQPNN